MKQVSCRLLLVTVSPSCDTWIASHTPLADAAFQELMDPRSITYLIHFLSRLRANLHVRLERNSPEFMIPRSLTALSLGIACSPRAPKGAGPGLSLRRCGSGCVRLPGTQPRPARSSEPLGTTIGLGNREQIGKRDPWSTCWHSPRYRLPNRAIGTWPCGKLSMCCRRCSKNLGIFQVFI